MLKNFVKKSFNLLGLELKRFSPPVPSPTVHHDIGLIFDVGANKGQYALSTRNEGFKGRIVSFEPLPDAHRQLALNAQKDPQWTVHPRCAVGARSGTTKINISKNSYSSSILPMLDAHSSAEPESVYIGTVETPVITLDSVFDQYRRQSENVFLKIDTQGFEAEVLAGCSSRLPDIKAVQIELSTVPLYEGQKLYRYFFDFFETNGFALWAVWSGFADRRTGQHLQFEAVFVNRSK